MEYLWDAPVDQRGWDKKLNAQKFITHSTGGRPDGVENNSRDSISRQ